MAGPVVAGALRPGTSDEPFESVQVPIAVRAAPLQAISYLAAVLTLLALLVAAASLVVVCAAPAAWSASSCAGWRSRPPWPGWRWRSSL